MHRRGVFFLFWIDRSNILLQTEELVSHKRGSNFVSHVNEGIGIKIFINTQLRPPNYIYNYLIPSLRYDKVVAFVYPLRLQGQSTTGM